MGLKEALDVREQACLFRQIWVCSQVGTILVDLFLRAAEETAVSSPPDGEEDPDNPHNRPFWHQTVLTERRSKPGGKSIRLKQGMIRCHDDILKGLHSIDQARVPHSTKSLARHSPPCSRALAGIEQHTYCSMQGLYPHSCMCTQGRCHADNA